MLFAARNKEFGAYALRRNAGRRYRIALMGLIVPVLLAVASPYIYQGLVLLRVFTEVKDVNLDKEVQKLKPLQNHEFHEIATGRRPRPTSRHDAAVGSPEIVDTPPIERVIEKLGPDVAEVGPNEVVNVEPQRAVLTDTLAPIQQDPLIATEVVEEMPQFPGGPGELMKWLDAHIDYPQRCIDAKEEGRIEVSFIVNHEGKVRDAKIAKPVHAELERCVLTAIQRMPAWKPGRSGGRVANVQVTIPIEFHYR